MKNNKRYIPKSKRSVKQPEFKGTVSHPEYELWKPTAASITYKTKIAEQDFEDIRDKFYTEFPVGFIEQVTLYTVIVIVPEGMYGGIKPFFKNDNVIKDMKVIVKG